MQGATLAQSQFHSKFHPCVMYWAHVVLKQGHSNVVLTEDSTMKHAQWDENQLLTFFLQTPFPPGTASHSLLMASLIKGMKKGQRSEHGLQLASGQMAPWTNT